MISGKPQKQPSRQYNPSIVDDNDPLYFSARGAGWWNPKDPRHHPLNPHTFNNPFALNSRPFSVQDETGFGAFKRRGYEGGN